MTWKARATLLAALASGAASLGFAARLPGEVELGNFELGARLSAPRSASRERAEHPPPRRIVSVTLLGDELVLALAPERLVAVSYVADDRRSTPAVFPKSLARLSGSAELIIAQQPELAVFSDYNATGNEALVQASGARVHHLHPPKRFSELTAEITRLGAALGSAERAQKLSAEIDARVHALGHSFERPPRLLLVQGRFAYARGTLQHDCLEITGISNALERLGLSGTPALTTELLLAADPDLVFVAAPIDAPGRASPAELDGTYPWELVRAVRAGRLRAIPDSWMSSISHHALNACEAYVALIREGA